MKKFLLSITILLSSLPQLIACGYSPYGEDVRYSLFNPDYFNYKAYSHFNYDGNAIEYRPNSEFDANIIDWHNYTNQKVSLKSIDVFMQTLNFSDIHADSNNEFIAFLYKKSIIT